MFIRCRVRFSYTLLTLIGLILFGGVCAGQTPETKAQRPSTNDKILGQWTGTWDGAGSGKLELTIKKDDAGKLGGSVAVTADAGDYTATFAAITFDGRKLTVKYNFPLADQNEVILEAAVEEGTAKGTWSLRPKGQDAGLAGGSWNVTKKKSAESGTGPSKGPEKSGV